MHFEIPSHIASVHIGIDPRIYHGMVKGSIEDSLVSIRASAHTHLAQSLVPFGDSLAPYFIECLAFHLLQIILPRALKVDERYADFHFHLISGSGRELCKEPYMLPLNLTHPPDDFRLSHPFEIRQGSDIFQLPRPAVRDIR